MKYLPISLVVLCLTWTLVAAVGLGETCNPLIPSLFCTAGGNMHCILENGAYICACSNGHTSNKENTLCAGTYDEFCVYSEDEEPIFNCNHDRGMRCSDTTVIGHGYCKCTDRDNQIFNEETETCVSIIGASCDLGATTLWERNCVSNAFCDENGGEPQCKCNEGFEMNSDRKCTRVNGEAGASCTSNSDCDFNVLHLQCEENVCQCGDGYSALLFNGTCVRDYGERCSSLDPCHEERIQKCSSFSAYPGKCVCEVQDWQVYMPSKACATVHGFECEGENPWSSVDCVINAECKSLDDGSMKVCSCKEGFIATHDRLCRPVALPELGDPCDTTIPYTCSADSHSVCTSHGEDETKGTCDCPNNSSPNMVNTRCYRRHGAVCMESEEIYCNADRHLECLLGSCVCSGSSDHVFNKERDACVALVYATCTIGDTEFDQPCVENAFCDSTQGLRCACNEGYEETTDRRCVTSN